MNKLLGFILARAKERTTWIGLIGLLSTAGVALKPEMVEAISSFGVALAGLVLVVTKDMEAKKAEQEQSRKS